MHFHRLPRPVVASLSIALCALLGGCAVVAVADTAVSIGAGVVGLGADAVIGTARLGGRAVGAVLPGGN